MELIEKEEIKKVIEYTEYTNRFIDPEFEDDDRSIRVDESGVEWLEGYFDVTIRIYPSGNYTFHERFNDDEIDKWDCEDMYNHAMNELRKKYYSKLN